ncbi:MAG: UbiD family decarboxylase, partial [Nitrososphaerota archaeon]|nr:UbiD family decarboxylase [Nitrososphaerota archaeon]
PLGRNEYALAGSLVGSPIQLIRAETSDLLVPADAEIVMEGEILPRVREKEAPYGEYTGYYGVQGMRPVVVVKRITHRRDPIYYSITARSSEVGYYFIAKTVLTQERIKEDVPGVKSANFLHTFFYVISLKKEREGDGRKAMLSAVGANDSIKYCVAVDDDINTRNPEEVLWAIATRCDPSKGTIIIPHTYGQMLDPSGEGEDEARVWSLMLIDATRPLHAPFPERARIPSLEEIEKMKREGKL